jgi:Fructose-bisphosphate aldolase class-II
MVFCVERGSLISADVWCVFDSCFHSHATSNFYFTDTQWAYWDGLRAYEKEKKEYLQGQIGNPTGADKPNKKFYDPRVWVRKAEESMVARVEVSMEKLSSKGTYEPAPSSEGHPQLGNPKKSVNPIILVTAGAIVGSAATLLMKVITK